MIRSQAALILYEYVLYLWVIFAGARVSGVMDTIRGSLPQFRTISFAIFVPIQIAQIKAQESTLLLTAMDDIMWVVLTTVSLLMHTCF